MRVVLLNQYYLPAEAPTALLMADLARALVAAGHDVRVCCSSRSYHDPSHRYASHETLDGVKVWRSRCTGYGRSSRLGRLTDYLTFLVTASATVARRGRADVVVSLSTPPLIAALGWLAATLHRARSVYWVMDIYPELAFELGVLRPGSMVGRAFAALSRAVLRRTDRVVALGETMAERLERVADGEVVVIHNWADGESIRPRAVEGHPRREAWGWDGLFVVMYSGNMSLAHEFETVLGAAELLRKREEVRFAFVGGGPRRPECEQAVEGRELPNVEFHDYVAQTELGSCLTSGDLHLVSLRAGVPGLLVPSKIYGILAAGRPTLYVGPDEGEIADLVRRVPCGTRVANDDAEGLARTILAYAGDPARRRSEGAAARREFEARYDRPRALRRFVELIEGL